MDISYHSIQDLREELFCFQPPTMECVVNVRMKHYLFKNNLSYMLLIPGLEDCVLGHSEKGIPCLQDRTMH